MNSNKFLKEPLVYFDAQSKLNVTRFSGFSQIIYSQMMCNTTAALLAYPCRTPAMQADKTFPAIYLSTYLSVCLSISIHVYISLYNSEKAGLSNCAPITYIYYIQMVVWSAKLCRTVC